MRRKRTKQERYLLRRVGERLRQLRKTLDKDQGEIAREIGVTQSMVSKWEHGKNAPPITYLPILARAYGITDAAEFARYLLADAEDDDDRLWRVGSGMVVVIAGLYACERCGDVRAFNEASIAPRCGLCGETVWRRKVL